MIGRDKRGGQGWPAGPLWLQVPWAGLFPPAAGLPGSPGCSHSSKQSSADRLSILNQPLFSGDLTLQDAGSTRPLLWGRGPGVLRLLPSRSHVQIWWHQNPSSTPTWLCKHLAGYFTSLCQFPHLRNRSKNTQLKES